MVVAEPKLCVVYDFRGLFADTERCRRCWRGLVAGRERRVVVAEPKWHVAYDLSGLQERSGLLAARLVEGRVQLIAMRILVQGHAKPEAKPDAEAKPALPKLPAVGGQPPPEPKRTTPEPPKAKTEANPEAPARRPAPACR